MTFRIVEAKIGQPQARKELERFIEFVIRSRLIERSAVPGRRNVPAPKTRSRPS